MRNSQHQPCHVYDQGVDDGVGGVHVVKLRLGKHAAVRGGGTVAVRGDGAGGEVLEHPLVLGGAQVADLPRRPLGVAKATGVLGEQALVGRGMRVAHNHLAVTP